MQTLAARQTPAYEQVRMINEMIITDDTAGI